MKSNVRILVVGDAAVGKSTFITSFVSNYSIETVPDVHPEHVLTGQFEGCNVTVMDSSTHAGDADILDRKILLADCVIVLFDANRRRTLDSAVKYWIPKINELASTQALVSRTKPIIICQNKSDLVLDLPQESVDKIFREVL
jgi:Ras family protein T1